MGVEGFATRYYPSHGTRAVLQPVRATSVTCFPRELAHGRFGEIGSQFGQRAHQMPQLYQIVKKAAVQI